MANSFLPEHTKACLEQDGKRNLDELELYLNKVSSEDVIVHSRVLGRLLRVIQTRLDLKYETDTALRSRIMGVLLDTYANRRCAIPLKTRLLNVAGRVCKNRSHHIELPRPFNWEYHWEELIALCTRSKKYEEVASEIVLGKLLQSQVAFLHSARRFITDSEASRVADRAMHQLKDTRHASCVEGLFLLVICLPTDFARYDIYMDQWLAMWSRIEHNATWDACWLTMLCRARKNLCVYTSFDWSAVVPYLFTKTRELLQLPGPVSSRLSNSAAYPVAIPGHYLFLASTSPFDARKTALHKIAKLLYTQCFYSFKDAPLQIVTAQPLPINQAYSEESGVIAVPGLNSPAECIVGARDLVAFYGSIRVFFHPSNTGPWSQDLGFLLGTQIGELARHVGREIAIRHGDVDGDYLRNLVRLPLHESTAKFLIGFFSSLLLEMLYSKNFVLSHIAAHGLKNLAPLSPVLCSVIFPSLVGTLDPSAVSKSHMALPAMSAISITFKSFLFPEPVVMQYLPAILQLALPGIDPNDTKKTLMTLSLYCKILSWIPVGEDLEFDESNSPNLLALAVGDNHETVNMPNIRLHFENARAAIVEWAPAFMDRMLALLDSTEDANQHSPDDVGAKKRRRHHSGSDRQRKSSDQRFNHIEEIFRLFFASISSDSQLVYILCDKVLHHLKISSPLHAAKEYTSLLAGMIASHSSKLLGKVLSFLLDENIRFGESSSEKLAFRLHLAGGAVRRASSHELLRVQDMDGLAQTPATFVSPFLTPKFSVQHPDIRVQEASRKLIRDLLRGLSATFPLEVNPCVAKRILGQTIPSDSSGVKWHVPTSEGIKVAAAILSSCCDDALSAVLRIAKNVGDMSKKTAEEELMGHLGVVHACCRGAADILGNRISENSAIEGDNEDGVISVVSTGRDSIVAKTGDSLVETKLLCLRDTVASTLLDLYDLLQGDNATSILAVRTGDNYATKVNIGSCRVTMTPDVAALWLRVFEALAIHRSWLKDPSVGKQFFSANKRQSTNSTARCAKRVIERFGSRLTEITPKGESYANALYWERYDLPPCASSDRGMIQYGFFAKEYAHSSMRSIIHAKTDCGTQSFFVSCFNRIVMLCGHEFESIRQDAVHTFNKVSGYGWSLEDLIQILIRNLNTAGIKYHEAAGTISILSCPLIIKLMVSRWYLMQQFLDVVPGTNAIFSMIDDMEKRHSLAEQFASLFVKYVDKWSHLPLQVNSLNDTSLSECQSGAAVLKRMLNEALKLCPAVSSDLSVLAPRFINQDKDVREVSDIVDGDFLVNLSGPAVTSGIRHELYVAYTVMHLIGHRDIAVPDEAWIWAIQQVCTRRGHPVAIFGMAVLARLAYTAAISVTSFSSVLNNNNDPPTPKINVPPAVLEILANESVWISLLEGFSSIGVKKPGESAQWSNGIDRMLRSADYIMQGFPRWITNNCFLNKTTGTGSFRPVEASLIMCLFVLSSGNFVPSKILRIIEATKQFASSNEEESKGHNTLRANLFGALIRILQASFATKCIDRSELDLIDALLSEFLFQQTQSISLSYCYDWADAIAFGFSALPVKISGCGLIPFTIINNARAVLASLGMSAEKMSLIDSSTNTVQGISDEGFSRHAKNLLLARGLLNADLAVVSSVGSEDFSLNGSSQLSYRHHFSPALPIVSILFSLRHNATAKTDVSRSSDIALELTKAFVDETSHVISSYRNVRLEIVEILSLLSYTHYNQCSEELEHISLKLCSAANIYKNASDVSSEVNAVMSDKRDSANNAAETAILWLESVLSGSTYRSAHFIEKLLTLALIGSGSADIDLAKRCHSTSLRAAAFVSRGIVTPDGELSRWPDGNKFASTDLFASILKNFSISSENESWRVRSTAVLATSVILLTNWTSMTLFERKDCKTVFNNAFFDKKPEIQLLGRAGMSAYLNTKLLSELNDLSVAYTKNNDIFAAREKKKRRQASSGGTTISNSKEEKIDNVYVTTIFMSASMLTAFPYDLPPFAPSLLISLLRHMTVPYFHDTVTRIVQDFKRTHQDKWDEEFKNHFTPDQLDDLQGAGAQSYFA